MKLKVLFSTLFITGLLGWYMAFSRPLALDHLSSSMTYNYVRSVVWYHSRGKIKELESILMNDDLSDKMAIKLKINNMLQHRTSVYLREFNALDAPIPKVGDHYEELFEFDNFLEEIYGVVFSKREIHSKLSLITDIMESYQSKANDQLLDLMKNTNIK
ncbi:hypothetical protein L1D19_20550 [Vibrio natriegens]|uniref:hypothetical protein n=1 Tax=Vibrio natriegens TaxID=691 RepID=UPI001EFD2348|nr:hypothetical protein [Vibrio natriegens]MCG9702462.1 hypothetical protein [Vibrio natriegens]